MSDQTLVTASPWGVSFSTRKGEPVELNAYQIRGFGRRSIVERHPLDGRTFATMGEARSFALAVGLLKVYVRPVSVS